MNCSISCLPSSFLNDFSPADSSVRLSSLHLILLFALSLSLCSSSPFSFVLLSLLCFPFSPSFSCCSGCQLSLTGQTSRDAVLYAAQHTGSSQSSVSTCVCVFFSLSAVLFPSFSDECSSSDTSLLPVFRTLLHR